MSATRLLILANGSWPLLSPERTATSMREANCASEDECCFRARSLTTRTASKFARSVRERIWERLSCKSEAWLKPYVALSAAPVASMMTCFALVSASSSSPRLFVAASKSCALVMQSCFKSAKVVSSASRSFVVAAKSPSAVAFVSPAADLFFFASSMSFLANFISSSNDCFSISKLWRAVFSTLRTSSSVVCALSFMLLSVLMMSPLWPWYAAAAGAPAAASSSSTFDDWLACTNADSFSPSVARRADACTKAFRACKMLPEFFNCSIDAPPVFAISLSRTATARSIMSMTSTNSFSSLT
mmetsp:Transcript_1452/g.4517  ORF Transcript_1452/g.4517 Transcript_1452/m.4517 type:complete len:301 (+) Transcript_1452:818-1720(+)